jgi:hypothetical protein
LTTEDKRHPDAQPDENGSILGGLTRKNQWKCDRHHISKQKMVAFEANPHYGISVAFNSAING